MYKLKDIARRSTALVAAVTMLSGVVSAAVPALASADALNPLTERTLMLTSSSPGHHYTDGSGNATYAPPGSGPNGQKTGETFSFKVSTDSTSNPVKAFTFQYCTTAAGNCISPGDANSKLNVVYPSAVASTDFTVKYETPNANTALPPTVTDVSSDGWTVDTSRVVTSGTGSENNFMTLKTTGTNLNIPAGTKVIIDFKASQTNYITNPGSGAFFVKINDYNDSTLYNDTTLLDGGVTVANVMNDSIQIETKVLETMSFSVGTENPDTVIAPAGGHGTCQPISTNAAIKLGDPDGENSLSPTTPYDGHSYWRLSSNSSNGATVYYAGYTLSNTVGDKIDEAGVTKASSIVGNEQFGLALDTTPDVIDTAHLPANGPFSANTVAPLIARTNYSDGAGTITTAGTAKFAFDPLANSTAVPLASEDTDVVNCATAKVRYLANIAANTPAGIYTSKINYIAAPQY